MAISECGMVVGWRRVPPFQKTLVRDETFKDVVWVKYMFVASANDKVLPVKLNN